MSAHSVEIIEIDNITEHPNADKLEIIHIGMWQVVAQKNQYKKGGKAIYIEPDYIVPTDRKEFSFLKKEGKTTHRLKAIKLRGIISYGLLIPVSKEFEKMPIGTNIIDQLGIKRYEPQIKAMTAAKSYNRSPSVADHKFDVESLTKYPDIFNEDDNVMVTEKVHGANARYVYCDGEFWLGSRNRWIDPNESSIWKDALTEEMKDFLYHYEDTMLFGEIYGKVQSLKYGLDNEVKFIAFAARLADGVWSDNKRLFAELDLYGVQHVPVLYYGKYNIDHIKNNILENDSTVSKNKNDMMEGVVITPEYERWDPEIGRVCLKLISDRYWQK